MMIDAGLNDKVVLITGANHGIGAATARAFSQQGAVVFITYLRILSDDTPVAASEPKTPGTALYNYHRSKSAEDVVRGIRDNGGRADAWGADLADAKTIPQVFDRAETAFGPVDVLVNNASGWAPDTFLSPEAGQDVHGFPTQTVSSESIDRSFAVDARAGALMMGEYARRYRGHGKTSGRIINVSTDAAAGFQHEVSYGASKHALESYSRAAAGELGRFGITVNVVSPGPVQTGYIPPEEERQMAKAAPLGRIGQPEDVADVIVFLASGQARWLTGQLIYVGGGHRIPL